MHTCAEVQLGCSEGEHTCAEVQLGCSEGEHTCAEVQNGRSEGEHTCADRYQQGVNVQNIYCWGCCVGIRLSSTPRMNGVGHGIPKILDVYTSVKGFNL